MNPEIHAEVTATVEWNALEATILKNLHNRESYPMERDYTLREIVNINAALAGELNPDGTNNIPEQLFDPKNCGTYRNPVQALFDRTETLLANMDRLQVRINEFEYDPDAEL